MNPFPQGEIVTEVPGLVVVVVLVYTGTPVKKATSKTSTAKTDFESPEWPANDASFDYRMPGISGARS